MLLTFVCDHDNRYYFFNDSATSEIYTLSLHDALPISWITVRLQRSITCAPSARARFTSSRNHGLSSGAPPVMSTVRTSERSRDRKSTRLNSSHANISYAVFCLKKKKSNCTASDPQYKH